VSIVFDTVVAGIELVNCQSCKVQVTGLVQTISIDKVDGAQLILSRASLNAEIISAKSSELNIVVPGENEGDEFKEFAIPEQFVSKWQDGKWDTQCMAHTG
jgi:adenylyl cyclase-associated protein